MASPPSDPSQKTNKKGAPIKFLVPLIYAPVLPMIRIAFRHKPVLRDRLFTGVLVGAFAHGMYLVYGEISAFESEACTCNVGGGSFYMIRYMKYCTCYLMPLFLTNMYRTDIYDAESK